MAVLVTRPQAAGAELCQKLKQQGIDSLLLPLIDISATTLKGPLFSLPFSPSQVDIIIAVSQHAVHHSDQLLRQKKQSWPSNVRYLAIGQKTARLLSKLTHQQVHYPTISDSEHLLADPHLHNVSGLNIIILRGQGGRELISETLRQRDANVVYKEVYQRVPRTFDAESSVALWQEKHVDCVIVTSQEQLELLVSQLPAKYLQWLFSLTLYVPSQRIAKFAVDTGFKNTITVGSASNSELAAALSQGMTGRPNDQ